MVERQAFLDQACAGDAALRAEVDRLLAVDARTEGFLETPIGPAVAAAISDDLADGMVGRNIGHYRILRRIASGGMGTVYEAIQEHPERSVALKIVRADLASKSALRRFVHEAEILARLRHPGIAQVFEAGSYEGMPYFAMEYIPDARTITEYAAGEQLSTHQRLKLFADVCDAIHHGHQRGIIHRDLKPGNILVDEADQPKVIDFGVARATDADMTIATLQTDVGQLVGTLRYMRPEQCEGDSAELDTRSDVYALGVVLYELLTGQFPYDMTSSSPFEIPRIIRETEPRRPSSISRLLRGEPIEARSDSRFYVLRKQVRRYRIPLGVAAGFVLLLIVSSMVAWTLYFESQERLWESYLSQARAQRWSGKPGQRVESLEALHQAAMIRPSAELRNEAIACLALTDAEIVRRVDYSNYAGRHSVADARLQQILLLADTGEADIHRVEDNARVLHLPPRGGPGGQAIPRFSPEGKYVARPCDSKCEIWEIGSERLVAEIPVSVTNHLVPLDFSPDGSELAAGTADGTIVVYRLASGVSRTLPPEHAPIHRIHYCPIEDTIATCSLNSSDVFLRDTHSGEVLRVLAHPAAVRTVAWSPDGLLLASACSDQHAYVWDVASARNQWTFRGHAGPVTDVGFDYKGEILFSTSWDGTTRLWDPHLGEHCLTVQAAGLGFAADGPWLGLRTYAGGLGFALAQVHGDDAFRSICDRPAESHEGCEWVRASADGQLAASALDTGVRIWDVSHGCAIAYLPIGLTRSAIFHPDGSALITVAPRQVLRWPLQMDSQVLRIGPPESILPDLQGDFWRGCLSTDGRTLVLSVDRHRAMVVDLESPSNTEILEPHRGMRTVSLSPDNRWLATGAWNAGDAKVWDLASGELVHVVPTAGHVRAGFSPDGKWLVTSEAEYVLWETGTWKPVARFPRNNYMGLSGMVAFSPDGELLAVISGTSTIELVHLARRMVVASLECPLPLNMIALCFTPDGTRLLFPGRQGHVLHVWDLRVVREQLAAIGLDWDLPPYPPLKLSAKPPPLRAEVDLGELEPTPTTE